MYQALFDAPYICSKLVPPAILRGRSYYHLHFGNEKPEAVSTLGSPKN